jgi:membrane protease YdiL (CAAX protease family)
VLQLGWNALVVANLQTSPDIPWCVPTGLAYLWVMFRFFNGRWGFRSTADARRRSMGARRLTSPEWRSIAFACVAAFVLVLSFSMLFHRLIAIPADPDLPAMPWWTLYPALIMVSIVAGVSEEAGFRGYMQGSLTKRYGPGIAIGITSLVFWLVHLNHPSGVARFPSLVMAGVVFGALTFVSRSILPSMVTHAIVDIVAFVGTTSGIGPTSLWEPPPIGTSGPDVGFWATLMVVGVSGVAVVVMLRRAHAMGTTSRESIC